MTREEILENLKKLNKDLDSMSEEERIDFCYKNSSDYRKYLLTRVYDNIFCLAHNTYGPNSNISHSSERQGIREGLFMALDELKVIPEIKEWLEEDDD